MVDLLLRVLGRRLRHGHADIVALGFNEHGKERRDNGSHQFGLGIAIQHL